MEKMSTRERVMAASNGQEPDRVPYCELTIDRAFAAKALGWDEKPYVNALEEKTPYRDEFYAEAEYFVRNKGDYA